MAKKPIAVETLTHTEAKRRNIPTAELQSLVAQEDAAPKQVRYPRETPLPKGERRTRNPDLDPQLVWRGKDEQDWSDLIVQAPPLYVQEKVHPKAIIADLLRQTKRRRGEAGEQQFSFFDDFNGLPDYEAKLEFYAHDQNWSNRFILGDSLQVMASLAEREGLRGKVQCIYFDPPYGIKFNSNWQVSTRSRDVKDGKVDQISREPEQVKAFRDTWKDGINSYLTYLRDRLAVARELLHESGSIFVQIGDDNVHRIRSILDEIFGSKNCVSMIGFAKTSGSTDDYLGQTTDYLLWYARVKDRVKFRPFLKAKKAGESGGTNYNRIRNASGDHRSLPKDEKEVGQLLNDGWRVYSLDNLTSQSAGREKGEGAASWFPVDLNGQVFRPALNVRWKTNEAGMDRLKVGDRLEATDKRVGYIRYLDDFPAVQIANRWDDVSASFMAAKTYVVQTSPTVVQRCILMATDPGDLVLDPTCGSGTTATVAEQWGRRWITIDTSRVALALARSRVMGARYPYYLLADSPEGHLKEADVAGIPPRDSSTFRDIRQGFVCERVQHIMLEHITKNAEIGIIWDRWQVTLEPLRIHLNAALGKSWEEWQIPRNGGPDWPTTAADLHAEWWKARIARQQEIDASIAAHAKFETLYDKPYTDPGRVRVAGPFTVESLSPHRVVATDDDELWEDVVAVEAAEAGRSPPRRTRGPQNWDKTDFAQVVLDHLKTSGVHQARKQDRITFTSLAPWPGTYVAAEARFMEGETERRAGIFIGPEFGTVARPDLVAAAREAADAGFPLLIACAFNFDAHASEFAKLGPVQVIRARINPDLHMADDLKNTGTGNLFVVFGEPDVEITKLPDDQVQVRIAGLDIFDPSKGEVRAGGTEDIAAWFIDTDYDEESFFVRHAYFLGANDPYKALKTTLKAEIDEEAWESLYRDTSRPFPRPSSGRIAVKVINHFGDEVMKVFAV